ncbi:MAG: hypothetical protein Ta2B_26160 [Termitinemataceae bacterium]|nr:MAG: hypothetical protein Ta2B_26160 [Termitinemataceae bacterium]
MKQKTILVVLFAAFIAANPLTAQEEKNTFSAGIANFGGSIGYERKIGANFSIGIETVGSFSFEINTYDNTSSYRGYISVEGDAKLYPGESVFFAKLGVGYNWAWSDDSQQGFFISPGLGLKIDIGRVGGFVLIPAIDVPLFFDKKIDNSKSYPLAVGVLAKLTIGYSF